MATLTRRVDDRDALAALYEAELSKRRVFLRDQSAAGLAVGDACELRLEVGDHAHALTAIVVYVREDDPGRGVGLELPDDAATLCALKAFVDGASRTEASCESRAAIHERPDERLRALSNAEQQKLAIGGTLSERIAIERLYGPNVWEALLRNPRLTIPEVARVARKGTLPRPLVELIAANASWLQAGEVQRALLSNPRSSAQVVARVLAVMPRGELQRVPQQTAYPASVRAAAKKLLGDR